MLSYVPNAPGALEDVADRFLGNLCEEGEDRVVHSDQPAAPPPRPPVQASFGLSQGILIPGMKHLMHNTEDDMLKSLRHYSWYTVTRL